MCRYRGHSHITESPRGRGFQNDYANVIVALSNAEFDYGRGEGSRNRQKVITVYVNGPIPPYIFNGTISLSY